MSSNTIGHYIRWKREAKNLGIKELAERSGLSGTGLYLIEMGLRTPRADTLARIAKALNSSMDSFFPPTNPN
jgi:transcriptional regulator with XRE-family HTH domain